jgi:hypothetical protein
VAPHIRRCGAETSYGVVGVDYFASSDAPAQERLGALATIEDVSFQTRLRTVASER